MKIRVCVAGATGWVGKPLCVAIAGAEDLALVGAVSRKSKGQDLRSLLSDSVPDLKVTGSVLEALETPTDVLIDYTTADAVKANVMTAIDRGVYVVIGASGLTNNDFVEINRNAHERRVGVIAAGNFAITAVLLQRFACEAARYLSHWEIIDYAADIKEDAPSGTARELAFRLSEVGRPKTTHPIAATVGEKDSRGTALNGTQVHSVRLPGYVLGVEAIFGSEDERLTIRHDAGSSPGPYIQGSLLAIRKVINRIGLTRGLESIMGSA